MKREKRGKGQHSRPGTPHQRPDGRWEQWVTIEGKRYKRIGESKQEVRDKITALRAELASPERRAARAQGPTLAERCEAALQKYDPDGSTHHTYSHALVHWRRLLGETTRARAITTATVQAAVDDLARPKAASTIEVYYAALRVALGADHPALKGIVLPEGDDEDEAPTLLVPSDLAERLQTVAQYHPLGIAIGLGLGTGVRAGEAAALRWQDVDLDRMLLSVNGSIKPAPDGWVRGKTKNRKSRLVTIPVDLADWLARHKRIQADTAALAGYRAPTFVLADPASGQGVTRLAPVTVLCELLADVCSDAELSVYGALRFHDLRHAHISRLLAQGVSPADLAARVGHTVATLHSHYTHITPGADAQLAALAGDLFPIPGPEATRQATRHGYTASGRGADFSRG
jgi:integrase